MACVVILGIAIAVWTGHGGAKLGTRQMGEYGKKINQQDPDVLGPKVPFPVHYTTSYTEGFTGSSTSSQQLDENFRRAMKGVSVPGIGKKKGGGSGLDQGLIKK